MTVDSITSLLAGALFLALKLAGPYLLAGLVVGVIISIVQAATQIQEMTLQFIPKIVVMVVVAVLVGPWQISEAMTYTRDLMQSIPQMVNGG